MGKIPDRWENYKALGRVIEGTRFIAFKVPLSEHLSMYLPCGTAALTPGDLVNLVKEQKNGLGLVIDLTNTTRYYKKEEIEKHEIKYEKIFTEGHTLPSLAVKKRFFKVVDDFLLTNKDDNSLVGVHCTHGLNRTGYLICRYMIDKLKMDPEESIRAFNEARGHDMERQNYLDDLRKVTMPRKETNETKPTCDMQEMHNFQRLEGTDDRSFAERPLETFHRERYVQIGTRGPRSNNFIWNSRQRREHFTWQHPHHRRFQGRSYFNRMNLHSSNFNANNTYLWEHPHYDYDEHNHYVDRHRYGGYY